MAVTRVLIMAGGTGGHVFPALAIARELVSRGVTVRFLGARGRMEEQLVPKAGFEISYIKVSGIRRNGLLPLLKAPFMVTRAVWEALGVIREFKPDAVLGMGGYAAGPGGVAAFLKGLPLFLHEQNAAPGLTNRLLARLACRVLLGFPGAFTGPKTRVVGNPLRREITDLLKVPREFSHHPLRILVTGGSLGAAALNERLPAAFKELPGQLISVRHQCGRGNQSKVAALYEGASFEFEVSDFIEDMARAYLECDLVICRAGAGSVCEVCCAGVPAIFVPLPTAVDDHQTKNAAYLTADHAACLIAQRDLSAKALCELILSLEADRARLQEMSDKVRSHAVTDAALRCCDEIMGAV